MTDSYPGARDLAERFVAATAARDLDGLGSLLDEQAVFWTNVAREDVDRAARLARIAVEFQIFERFEFDAPRIDDFGTGFVIRATARGAFAGGEFAFPICIVGEVGAGLITRVEEYLDPAAVTGILAAMAASGEQPG